MAFQELSGWATNIEIHVGSQHESRHLLQQTTSVAYDTSLRLASPWSRLHVSRVVRFVAFQIQNEIKEHRATDRLSTIL
jgi:hypothetical protein